MTNKRVIYVRPGDMIEIRIVPEGRDLTARGWNSSARPDKTLIRAFGENKIAFALADCGRVVDWSTGQLEPHTVVNGRRADSFK